MKVCEYCGKEIKSSQAWIKISYGGPKWGIRPEPDYFHKECSHGVAVRE